MASTTGKLTMSGIMAGARAMIRDMFNFPVLKKESPSFLPELTYETQCYKVITHELLNEFIV